jgi:Uma2 family endonuclease
MGKKGGRKKIVFEIPSPSIITGDFAMARPRLKEDTRCTYGDYQHWPEDERYELIDGVVYDMSPAPSRKHQEILVELGTTIANYLRGKPCKIYFAPFDVRLPVDQEKDEDITTVVQPDLVVVCDRSKLDDRGCRGAPDFVVEILSPSSAANDYIRKLALYERHGVKEYWIIHPLDKIVMVYSLDSSGGYGKPQIYCHEDRIDVGIFAADLTIELAAIFQG